MLFTSFSLSSLLQGRFESVGWLGWGEEAWNFTGAVFIAWRMAEYHHCCTFCGKPSVYLLLLAHTEGTVLRSLFERKAASEVQLLGRIKTSRAICRLVDSNQELGAAPMPMIMERRFLAPELQCSLHLKKIKKSYLWTSKNSGKAWL